MKSKKREYPEECLGICSVNWECRHYRFGEGSSICNDGIVSELMGVDFPHQKKYSACVDGLREYTKKLWVICPQP